MTLGSGASIIDFLTQVHAFYPRNPKITTCAMQHLKFRPLPSGINDCFTISCHSGRFSSYVARRNWSSSISVVLYEKFWDQKNISLSGTQESVTARQWRGCDGINIRIYEYLDYHKLVEHVNNKFIYYDKKTTFLFSHVRWALQHCWNEIVSSLYL